MNRERTIHVLRISVSGTCLTLSLLLVVLWIRSYWRYDWLGGLGLMPTGNNQFQSMDGCLIESANGVLVITYAGNAWERLLSLPQFAGSWTASPNMRVTGDNGESTWDGFQASVFPNGTFRGSAPHWSLVLVFGALAAAFGIRPPYRFSMRTLLVVTTLVAVVLGATVIAAR